MEVFETHGAGGDRGSGAGQGHGQGHGQHVVEQQLSELKEQHGQFRQEVVSRIEEKNGVIRRVEEENKGLRAQLAARVSAAEAAALREQCENHAKERAALKTILENKVRTLLENVGKSLSELPREAQEHPRLFREVHALSKLVAATVNALKTSEEHIVKGGGGGGGGNAI